MLALMDQTHEPFIADEAEAVVARKAAERLKTVAEANQDIKITVEDGNVIVPLPARAVALIYEILQTMANRVPMSIIPHDAELTTQQAADYLNVSRPYLVKRIDAGDLVARKVGSHRRILFGDLLAYERAMGERQAAALARLHAEERRLDLE